MSVSNYTRLAQKYKQYWNRKLLSLLDSVPLKMSEIRALVPCELVLGPGVWLVFRVLASWPSMLANCLLVLLFWQGLDCEQVKNISLLAVKLVIGLVAGASSKLRSLFTGMILGLGTDKASWPDWIVLEGDLGDKQPLWWIHLEYHRVFGR